MVDGTGLENRHTRKGIGGSNPSLSASETLPLKAAPEQKYDKRAIKPWVTGVKCQVTRGLETLYSKGYRGCESLSLRQKCSEIPRPGFTLQDAANKPDLTEHAVARTGW